MELKLKPVEGVPESVFTENIPKVEGYIEVYLTVIKLTDDPQLRIENQVVNKQFYINFN